MTRGWVNNNRIQFFGWTITSSVSICLCVALVACETRLLPMYCSCIKKDVPVSISTLGFYRSITNSTRSKCALWIMHYTFLYEELRISFASIVLQMLLLCCASDAKRCSTYATQMLILRNRRCWEAALFINIILCLNHFN